jgi:hypothetical protein
MLTKLLIKYVPDFSVRPKKILSRKSKMDIFKMSKNVQNGKVKGSLKRGVKMQIRGYTREFLIIKDCLFTIM